MKPDRSRATIGSLPSRRANVITRSKLSREAVTGRTTSTSGMSGTGLKKWRPTKRSGRLVAEAMAPMGRLEVFDAKIVAGGRSCRAPPEAVLELEILGDRLDDDTAVGQLGEIGGESSRSSAPSRADGSSFPFSTSLASDFSIAARPSQSGSG